MSRLSFQEKMLWAQLVALLAVGVYYARFLAHSGPGHHYFHAVLVVVILVFIFFRFIVRRGSGNVVEDERDRSIAGLGARWSNVILWVGLGAMLVMYWDHGGVRTSGFAIDLIFHLLLLAGLVRIVRELVAYRRTS